MGFGGTDNKSEQAEQKLVYEQAAKRFFSQEFINRLDKILAFRSLSKNDLQKIAKNKLQQLQDRLKGYSLEFANGNVAGAVAAWALEKQQEARGIDIIIRENLENHLAQHLLNANKSTGKIKIKLADKKFTFASK